MPFTPNIPTGAQLISATQPLIQGNFNSILAAFDQNHADFNAVTAGEHTFIQLVPAAAWPVIGSFPGSAGFWASTAAGNPVMLHTAAGADINLQTALTQTYSYATTPGVTAQGSTTLPSGLILKWGRFIMGAGGQNTFNFTAAFPTACYSATVSTLDAAFPVQNLAIIRTISAAGLAMGLYNAAGTGNSAQTFFFFAIGH